MTAESPEGVVLDEIKRVKERSIERSIVMRRNVIQNLLLTMGINTDIAL
jgi:hypothetical protein